MMFKMRFEEENGLKKRKEKRRNCFVVLFHLLKNINPISGAPV